MPLMNRDRQFDAAEPQAIDINRQPEPTSSPEFLSTLGAAFRQSNIVASAMADETAGLNRYDQEEGFNFLGEIKGTKYEGRAMDAASIFNRPYAEAWKRQVDREEEDARTLDSAGWLGTGASAVAAILDLPSLIPGGEVIGGLRAGSAAARGALTVAAAGGVGAALSEAGLQATQQTRTLQDSAIAIGSGVVFGGLLGGGVGALMSKAEQRAAVSAITAERAAARAGESVTPVADEIEAMVRTNSFAETSAGAARVTGNTMEDLTIAGSAARGVAKATGFMNPLLRGLGSESLKVRQLMSGLAENPVYLKMNAEGRGEQAVETVQKQWDRGAMSAAVDRHRKIYQEARAAGTQLTQPQFNEAISRAMRRGDTADDPAVAKAAQAWRSTVFNPLKDEAIRVGLLPADVDVKTAESYLMRMWNPRKIEAQEPQFRAIATEHVRGSVEAAVAKLTATRDSRLARTNAEISDLELPAEQRAQLLRDLPAQLKQMQDSNPRFVGIDQDLGLRRSERAKFESAGSFPDRVKTLTKEIDQITADAGSDYADFVTARNALRTRISRVKNNVVGAEDQIATLNARAADVEAANVERLRRLHRSLDIIDEDIQKSSPEVWQEKLAKARTQFAQVLERSSKARERIGAARQKASAAIDELRKTPDAEADNIVAKTAQQSSDIRTSFEKLSDQADAAEIEFAAYQKKQTTALEKAKAANDAGRAADIERRLVNRQDKHSAYLEKTYGDLAGALDQIDSLNSVGREDVISKLLERNADRASAIEAKMTRAETSFERVEAKRLDESIQLSDKIADIEAVDPEQAVAELRQLAEARMKQAAQVVERETLRMQQMAARATDPAKVKFRVDTLRGRIDDIERAYADRVDIGLDAQNGYESYVNEVVDGIFNTLTGRSVTDIPRDIVPTARGPLKERTFNIPDKLVEDFLENDIELVGRRYARTMAADVEMTRKYGSVSMVDQITGIQDEYQNLRQKASETLEGGALEKELRRLSDREKADIRDVKAVRDLLRGSYAAADNSNNFARIARAAQTFNYMRSMGGVLVASLTDAVRPAMVHGLSAYMSDGIGPLVKNLKGLRMSAQEAKLAGTISDRILQSRLATMAELTDPYSSSSPFERFLDNAANKFTTLTGLNHWNDFHRTLSSVMTQNRVLRNIEDGVEKLEGREKAYMGYLGLDSDASARIKAQFAEHGEDVDGVKVTNTEDWTDDVAKRAYYAALNKDVDSIITVKGVADVPLFTHTPLGRAAIQFKSFALASNQRVLMRGLQEGPGRMMGGIAGMTSIGAFIYWLKAMESGREVSNNPGTWVAEGLDRSGIFAIGFEINNTLEKAGLPLAYSGAAALGRLAKPSADARKPASRFATRSVVEGFLGPTFGLANDVVSTASIGLRAASGDADIAPSDIATLRRLAPYASLPYWRWLIDGGFGFKYGATPMLKEAVQ